MRVFFSEFQAIYATYTFTYAAYCLPETPDELPLVYERGFLPYSGDLSLSHTLFYLARSVRLDLRRFADSSENRRVDRKASRQGIDVAVRPKQSFPIEDPRFLDFCLGYAEARFAGGAMDRARLLYVLNTDCLSHVFIFSHLRREIGYALAVSRGAVLHYWFAFYDTALARTFPLGKWMMWRAIHWALQAGMGHVYLGTCYGEKSLYKVRDHAGAEFFDGVGWDPDVGLLKRLCHADDRRGAPARDRFKADGFPAAALGSAALPAVDAAGGPRR
jgi:arginine-tRNA-protein transferase